MSDNIETVLNRISEVKDLCVALNLKVALQNGRVKINEKAIMRLKSGIRSLQDDDLIEEGVKKGKRFFIVSTRNMIVLVLTIVSVSTALYRLNLSHNRNDKADRIVRLDKEIKKKDRQINKINKLIRSHTDVSSKSINLTSIDLEKKINELIRLNK